MAADASARAVGRKLCVDIVLLGAVANVLAVGLAADEASAPPHSCDLCIVFPDQFVVLAHKVDTKGRLEEVTLVSGAHVVVAQSAGWAVEGEAIQLVLEGCSVLPTNWAAERTEDLRSMTAETTALRIRPVGAHVYGLHGGKVVFALAADDLAVMNGALAATVSGRASPASGLLALTSAGIAEVLQQAAAEPPQREATRVRKPG